MTNELHSKFHRIDAQFGNIDSRFDHLEQTNQKILEALESLKSEMTESKAESRSFRQEMHEFKAEMHEFKEETEEKFELIIDNAVTKTEFEQTISKINSEMASLATKMATKDQLIHFTDRIDAKFLDFKHNVIESIRHTNKKFLKFAL